MSRFDKISSVPGFTWNATFDSLASRLGAIFVLCSCAAGCGGKYDTFPVEGTVKFSDGAPLVGGTITFEAVDVSIIAIGHTDRDGAFHLGTTDSDDGAVAGRYRAVVVGPPPEDLDAGRVPSQVHPKYRTFETSGLEFDVSRGTNFFEIVVERP